MIDALPVRFLDYDLWWTMLRRNLSPLTDRNHKNNTPAIKLGINSFAVCISSKCSAKIAMKSFLIED